MPQPLSSSVGAEASRAAEPTGPDSNIAVGSHGEYIPTVGQALNPARPTSLKTVPAKPKIRRGREDVKSQRR